MTTAQSRMATLAIDQHSYALMKSALMLLPRRVGFKVLRKALNAWGGLVKTVATANIPEESGLLKKSLRVKVVIPDSSYNEKHHGKPAYVMVGPSRSVVGAVANGKQLSDKKAFARVMQGRTQYGKSVQTRRPSRYAHLVERGTKSHLIQTFGRTVEHPGSKPHPFIAPAQAAGNSQGLAILRTKLGQGIQEESAAIAARN